MAYMDPQGVRTPKNRLSGDIEVLADTVRTIAKNETNHAKVFFEAILKNAGSCDDVYK